MLDDFNIYWIEIKSSIVELIFNEIFEFIGYLENDFMELIFCFGLYGYDKFSRGKMIGYMDVWFNLEKFYFSELMIIWRNLLFKF